MVDSEVSSSATVAKLTDAANVEFGLKHYDAASELYSRAAEIQDEVNGELAPENADLLFLYGRCLYNLAVSQSDVLGGKVASEEKSKKKSKASNGEGSSSATTRNSTVSSGDKPTDQSTAENKPYFSLQGDVDWNTDSDDEDVGAEGDAEEDEDDDFKTAYEILDTARVILQHKLEDHTGHTKSEDNKGKGKAGEVYPGDVTDPVVRATKEKLAEILNLQADISLESEQFQNAVPDNRAILALRKEFLPPGSAYIAESYYKLSLALEFASMTFFEEEGKQPQVDSAMRNEAVKAMEDAIASCHLRVKTETDELESLTGEEKAKKELNIKDVTEMIEDMGLRLLDLKADPLAVPNLSGPAEGSSIEEKARIEEAVSGANDLSGLVKKKEKPAPKAIAGPRTATNGKGKRKLEDGEDSDTSKKAKVEDA